MRTTTRSTSRRDGRTRSLLALLRGRRPRGEAGAAMITVIGTTMVITALVVATLAFTVNGVRSARGDQDWQAALPAADAGIGDYLSRLNEDGTYWRFGNPASAYSATSAVTLPGGADANPAFTGWTDVPGSSGRAQFRYDVNTSEFFSTGLVKVRSTGRVGERTRTVESTIGRRNFIDYLYFTDFEVKDPDLYTTSGTGADSYNPTEAYDRCNRHLYDVVGGQYRRDRVNSDYANRTTGCTVINFIGPGVVSGFDGDTINGPFHSNDAVYVCGNPTISAEASTSYDGALTGGRNYLRNRDCSHTSTPQIASSGNDFVYEPPLTLPPSNTELSLQVDHAHTGGDPGCLYTGPTQITFVGDNKMNVVSPWSDNGGSAWCGTGVVELPDRGVIWVRDVPTTDDAYRRDSPVLESGGGCTTTRNPLGYPKRFGSGGTARTDITPYRCDAGDAFVSGTLKGQVTIGTDNNIVVTDDLTYASPGCTAANSTCTDLLGLVANNYIEVYHPYGCRSNGSNCGDLSTAQRDIVIEAAILSVKHSFRVQNYQYGGDQGDLTVKGAIGQRYRGAVGTTSGSGYAKKYEYDWRLRYASPPYFLDPVESAYGQKTWSEPRAAYGP
ncbi:pilus assembly PilX N-terminal domain-containing protein [Aquipuribacter sp. MA13-6]|uniref:pilus assembly PilX N-terminal domain-containing protein n=1 Tax=unclassified Aquipuribacter TaxID=2635084 RepID=UPI003EE95985